MEDDHWQRVFIRLAAVAMLPAMPVLMMAACSGDSGSEETAAAPAEVPDLGTAQLGAGAGPTPIPVTHTPTVTPSPKHLSLYDPVWEGTFTIHETLTKEDITKSIVMDFMLPNRGSEGKNRRRDVGAVFVEGADKRMALAFVQVDSETGDVSFRVPPLNVRFEAVMEGDKMNARLKRGS